MDAQVLRLIGYAGAVLVGLGVVAVTGRREADGQRTGLVLLGQGGVLLAVSLGNGDANWALAVVVIAAVWTSIAISATNVCERESESADVVDWTPETEPAVVVEKDAPPETGETVVISLPVEGADRG